MTSLSVFIFGVFNFFIMYLAVYSYKKDWRESFILAALYLGVFIWGLTEFLSLFNILNFNGVICGWIFYDVGILSFLFTKYKNKSLSTPKISLTCLKCWEFYFIGILLITTFFLAIIYPPSNWDSMTYHLPRIEHWIQNMSLSHYNTSIPRQLYSAPFSEIVILHGRLLSGDDWLMNLAQWFAFLGAIIGISKIVADFGLNRKSQIIAALFFATLPMAILQASSTQNDLVETLWIICLAERFLAWRKEPKLHYSIDFGIALGLAICTKGTAYPIAFAFVVAYAIMSIRQYRTKLIGALCAATICLMLNVPHYIRNYVTFKNPIETSDKTMASPSVESFFISLFSNIYVNIPIPVPKSNEINEELFKVDKNIYPYGSIYVYSKDKWLKERGGMPFFHEDFMKNTFHTIFIIIAFISVFYIKKKRCVLYSLIVLACWGMFVLCIPWQPWITRLQTPLFALSAPLFAFMFNRIRYTKLKTFCLLMLCGFSLLPLFFNRTRPLLSFQAIPIVEEWTLNKMFWNTSRDELVFYNYPGTYQDYTSACYIISKTNTADIGLIIGADTWEYPLWRYMRHTKSVTPQINHEVSDSIYLKANTLFILNRSNNIVDINDKNKDIPFVYQRDVSQWVILYPYNK